MSCSAHHPLHVEFAKVQGFCKPCQSTSLPLSHAKCDRVAYTSHRCGLVSHVQNVTQSATVLKHEHLCQIYLHHVVPASCTTCRLHHASCVACVMYHASFVACMTFWRHDLLAEPCCCVCRAGRSWCWAASSPPRPRSGMRRRPTCSGLWGSSSDPHLPRVPRPSKALLASRLLRHQTEQHAV